MSFLWRMLFRILHDERVISRMSESRPIRSIARICAGIFMQSKTISQDPALQNLKPKEVISGASNLAKEFAKTLKEAKDEFKKGIK